MPKNIDLLIISPGNNKIIYQDLAKEYSAIEPPVWAGLLTKFAQNQGYDTVIIDQEAQGLSSDEIAQQGLDLSPKLVVVVVYGQQPSASTQNMTMAEEICSKLRSHAPHLKTLMVGGHVSALPKRTLEESDVDFVCQGEGPHTIQALLQLNDLENNNQLAKVPGLWYRQNGKPIFSGPSPVVSEKELPVTLNGVAWDMLPMDAYRAHNWHCFDHIGERTPYATLYTSLGCPYKCTFCCINAPFGKPSIRYWDPDFVIKELDILATKYGVKNIKLADEMFVLQEDHVIRLCDLIIERGYDFNFWAYARVDTVKDRFLEKLKKAGFNWLCLGIESKSKHVREGAQKGHYNEQDITSVVRKIQDSGIYIIGNYMFGLPDDDNQSMRETLDLAMDLNCEWANFYSGMAYPGSKLYDLALQKGWKLPEKWQDFSQHSYRQIPLATDYLSAVEVLSFRDGAWVEYFTNPKYLSMLGEKFGQDVVDHVNKLNSFTLTRHLLEECPTT